MSAPCVVARIRRMPHLGTHVLQQRHFRQVCVDQRQQKQLDVVRVAAPPEIADVSQELPSAPVTEWYLSAKMRS